MDGPIWTIFSMKIDRLIIKTKLQGIQTFVKIKARNNNYVNVEEFAWLEVK